MLWAGAGSAVSTDSGVWTGGEGGEGGELSPRSRRRPRNLEMVMRGSHSFHLRELQVADLDIMGRKDSNYKKNYILGLRITRHYSIRKKYRQAM